MGHKHNEDSHPLSSLLVGDLTRELGRLKVKPPFSAQRENDDDLEQDRQSDLQHRQLP